MGNFQEFKSNINNFDVARNYLFDVFIPVPPIMLIDDFQEATKKLMFTCESAELPGRAFATTTQKIYGPTQKFPVLSSYSNIKLTFICEDRTFFQKKFFDAWFEYINPSETFNFSYKQGDGYTSNITISQYTQGGTLLYKLKLIDAFPVDMTYLGLDWSNSSNHKLTIDFAYTRWEAEYVAEQALAYPVSQYDLSNFLAMGIKLANFGYNVKQALNSGSVTTGLGIFASTLPSMGFSNFNLSSGLTKLNIK